ncbi:MAG: hypothetical protein OD811_00210 [Alphaproteobacteria bacterium]
MYSIHNLTNVASAARQGEVEIASDGMPKAQASGLGARLARGMRNLLERLRILRSGPMRGERQEKAAESIQTHLRLRFNNKDLRFSGMNATRITTKATALAAGLKWITNIEQHRLGSVRDETQPFSSFDADRPLAAQSKEMKSILPAGFDTWPHESKLQLQFAYRHTFSMVLNNALHRGDDVDVRRMAKLAMASSINKCETKENFEGYRESLERFQDAASIYTASLCKGVRSTQDMSARMRLLSAAESRLMSYETLPETKKCSAMPLALGKIKDTIGTDTTRISVGLSFTKNWATPILADQVASRAEGSPGTSESTSKSAVSLLRHLLQDPELGSRISFPDEVSIVLNENIASYDPDSHILQQAVERLGMNDSEFADILEETHKYNTDVMRRSSAAR